MLILVKYNGKTRIGQGLAEVNETKFDGRPVCETSNEIHTRLIRTKKKKKKIGNERSHNKSVSKHSN